MEHSGGTVTFKAEKFELPLSQSLKSEASEAMDDSFNDIDFAEIDWNFCVPNAKTETDHRSGKDLADDRSLKGDSEDAGKGTKGFCGFSTGLGKSVKVSDKALQHAKKLLEDTLEDEYVKDKVTNKEDIEAYPNSVSKNTGVKTVLRHNKKSVSSNFESSEYIMGTDAKCEDSSGDANYCCLFNGCNSVSGNLNLQSHQTEASSPVSENLFHHKADQLACLEKVSKESTSNAKLVQDTNIGFKTARGTNIVVNPEALNKVKRLWAEEMKLEDQQVQTLSVMDDTEFGFKGKETIFDSNIKFPKNLQIGNAMPGFATAAGKALTVSEKALKKAQGLLEESSEEAKLHYNNLSGSVDSTRQVLREEKEGRTIQNQRSNTPALKDEARDIMNRENYQESKTSSSSAVLISHKQMDETKKLTEELADVDGKCSGDKLSCAQVKGPTKSRDFEHLQQFGGFSTARGTKVRISNAALLRARKLWEEDDTTSGDLPDPKFGNTLQSMVSSEVSETQTKEREKSLHSNKEAIAPSPNNFLGFCTGQGKPVEVSKESLARNRNIFEDIDIPEDEKSHGTRAEVLQPECKSKDFADVGGRNLEVNGGYEVGNTNSVLDLEEKLAGEEKAYNLNQNFNSHRGFVTGRGKCVEVKKETLERVSKMFMDENDIIECEKNLEYNENNLRNLGILNMDGENASKKEKLREHEDEHIEETIDFPVKEQHCAGSQKTTTRLAALDRGVPIKCGKRKFSELGLAELDPDKQIARPSNKRLSLGNSRNTNGIPRKSISKLGRRGHSQSAKTSHEMHLSPAAKSQSQPTLLAPSPHPLPPESHTKAQDSLQTLGKITALTDTQEICAITEAFLEDDLREGKDSLESFNRKRSREASGYDGPSGKKFRVPQMPCSQMEDAETYAADEVVESGREMARLKQRKVAQYKEKRPVTPIQGVLHRFRSDKKHSRIKMQSLGSLKVNRNVSCEVASINASNARMFRFPVKDRRCETVTCEDGCTLVPSSDGFIGVKEIEQGFLAAPGVHPGLVPPSWVINHYRWIVWKLAALERRLPHSTLTPENVMARLKYRYDREIDRAERPILRKIMEHDDVPQKTMILCVAHVKKTPETTHEGDGVTETRPRSPYAASETILELTDGWYSIDALTDTALSRFVLEEKVKIGTKLLIHGAEMAKHSPPCHPLQASSSVCLRLHTNMTRRAKWWSRLGLAPQCGPLPTLIRGIQGDGGLVGRLTVLLARVYPPLYFEKTGGKSVFRSERAHNRLLRENQREKERNVHQILAEVEREFDSRAVSQRQSRKTSSSVLRGEEIRNLTSGKDIAQVMEEAMDPSSLEGLLSTHQIELARSWRQREAEERKRLINLEVQQRLAKKQKLYEAVTILKIRIVDTEGGSALVTIWRPTEEIIQALTEGTVFSVHYLCANGHKYGDLQLTATRQTRWERLTSPSLSHFQDVSREVTPLCLTSSGELAPLWREVDVVGIVLRVGGLEAGCQLVHLVDHQVNILALKFWGGIKECGMEDKVQVGVLLCVSNGSWRGHTGGRFGCVHITELTAVTTQPRRPHLEEQASHLKRSVENMKTLLCDGDMKLDGQFNERVSPEGGTSPSQEQSRVGQENGQGSTVHENAQGDYEKEHKDGTPSTGLGRLQQRSREIRSKFKALGSYGTPSALRSLKSPASRGTHKPFRMPFRQPLDSAKNQ
ncbi:breast cancer type 2 susceptibility protein homolog [Penaeus chinensis]|uniref:breast cancer type 2 susceptibility protein homolog n=1 Tax=Penaeus chinensis TaxID=139456 RepID=UPI001FB6211E|nr:breast cancer type 2 susceptibility protein homolog [Penaeus chinensis]